MTLESGFNIPTLESGFSIPLALFSPKISPRFITLLISLFSLFFPFCFHCFCFCLFLFCSFSSFWGAAPEGQMTYDSTQGDFLRFPVYSPPSPRPQNRPSDPKTSLSDPKSNFQRRCILPQGTFMQILKSLQALYRHIWPKKHILMFFDHFLPYFLVKT